jgi:D-sedoheptulose 7-phosphate isomerase
MKVLIENLIQESIDAKKDLFATEQIAVIERAAVAIVEAYAQNKKTLVCGNGGSACDALHFATELVVRFEKNRQALPSIALSESVSTLTAAGNDFGFDEVFSRQVEAFGQAGDILVAISTSGNSKNVLRAIEEAKKKNMYVIAMTNSDGGKIKEQANLCFCAPSKITARVQECHILFIHIIAKIVEEQISKSHLI